MKLDSRFQKKRIKIKKGEKTTVQHDIRLFKEKKNRSPRTHN
jgi:hypothetical protein